MYLFYHPTVGRRLNQRHCIMGVQPIHKAAYYSSFCNKYTTAHSEI